MKTFSLRLSEAIAAKQTPVLVGIDPRFDQLPETMTRRIDPADPNGVASAFEEFGRKIIDVVAPLVPMVKPQSAFFEQYGPAGMTALAGLIRYAQKKGLLVLLDGKRNDIGSTAAAYAAGFLGPESPWGADALTVSPYLGGDSLEPFVKTASERSAGIFILVKTSNPGGAMIQDLTTFDSDRPNEAGETIYRRVAGAVESLAAKEAAEKSARYGSVGAVVGATWPKQLAELRGVMKSAWLLVPGYGSQGGAAADVAAAFDEDGFGAVVNNSRGINFAFRKKPWSERFGAARWEEATEAATREMIDALAAETTAGKLK